MKLFAFTWLLLLAITGYSQNDTIYVWNKWSARKDTMLLFNAGNNLIQIVSPSLKPADIKLKSLDKGLRIGLPEVKGDTTSVLAMPYPDKGKTMRLAILNKKTNRPIKTINFSSDNIPAPQARLGSIKADEAARKDILLQQTIKASFPNSLYSYPYHIKSYTFKINTATGNAVVNVNGFFVNKEILQQIKDAPAGTVIEFTNIKATCPECATRTLSDLKIKIR